MYIVFVSTWSLLGVKKKLGLRPDRFPLGVLLKISDEHPHPLHMRNSPPPREVDILNQFIRHGMEHFDCLILSLLLPILTQFCLDYIQCRGK